VCGIYGMVSPAGIPLRRPEQRDAMRRALAHRGPDGHGCVSRLHAVIGVNRLRIIDRRSQADQPFTDPSGDVWLAVNGEIYNAQDLRRRYPDYPYRSRSDVEPVLPLYLARGAEGLAELDGMFALAIWDERSATLTLARDRAGEKPLFHSDRDGEVWFASEIQGLLQGARPSLDAVAAGDIVRLGYPLEPRTIWSGISRVESGTILSIGATGKRLNRYWPPDTEPGTPDPETTPPQLASLLETSVRKQLVADVPIGVFLSGGLDSSLLVGLATRQTGSRVGTFTVGFPDTSYDESAFARRVAAHFGTEHVESIATETVLHEALDTITGSVAEPITDPAVLPTLLLARTARGSVGVVLSGEGADELFGGYPTYLGHRLAPWFSRIPKPFRAALAAALAAPRSSYGKVTLEYLLKRFVAGAELPWFERHLAWFGSGLPGEVLDAGSVPPSACSPYRPSADVLNQAMLWDYTSYLRDLLLPKIDRATSLVALETRAPYLDAGLTRYAWSLPASHKLRGLTTKWLLRRAARGVVPRWVLRRRKRGLSVPVAAWLNGGLSRPLDRVLDPTRLRRQGLLNPRVVSQLVAGHRAGNLALSRGLWTLFTLEAWMDQWMPEEGE